MMDIASYSSLDQKRGLGQGLGQRLGWPLKQERGLGYGQRQSPTYKYGDDDGGFLNDDFNNNNNSDLGGDDDDFMSVGVPVKWIPPQSEPPPDM